MPYLPRLDFSPVILCDKFRLVCVSKEIETVNWRPERKFLFEQKVKIISPVVSLSRRHSDPLLHVSLNSLTMILLRIRCCR